jgi:hypothetical protein
MRARRTDANHTEIRDAMRDAGAEVFDLSGCGKGAPDTLVFTPGVGLRLVEIKVRKGKTTPAQDKFHARFPVEIVRTKEEAIALLSNTKNDEH